MSRTRVAAAVGAAVFAMTLPATPAHADPLPDFCTPTTVVDNVCTVRLASVTADTPNGTITGSPVAGGAPITLAGSEEAYLKSAGFEASPPDAIQQWDTTIDEVTGSNLDPSDPNWYGNAKSRAFLPRTLNSLATEFPPDVLEIRFTPDDSWPGVFKLVSIQPTAG